jgi:hypothetical protein
MTEKGSFAKPLAVGNMLVTSYVILMVCDTMGFE